MKKSKPLTVKFRNRVCLVEFGQYSNGRVAIQLNLKRTGEPFLVATHNLPKVDLEENEVIIKDYDGNEGIVHVLVEAGIVKFYNKWLMHNGAWPVAELQIKPTLNQSDMITRNNYFEQVGRQNILARFPDARQYHDFVTEATDGGKDWAAYEDEKETRQLIDSYFAKLNEKLQVSPASANTSQETSRTRNQDEERKVRQHAATTKGKQQRKTAKPAKHKKPATKSAKQKQKVLNLPKGKLVELVDPHLLFIGRYLRMNNQKRTLNALSNFFSQINHAADARVIRKASPYAAHIVFIQKQLLKLIEMGQEEITVKIPAPKYNELLRVFAKEQQMASVRLLKRYHNMAGRPTTDEKAKKLYNEMYKAVDTGLIPKNDRLFKRVLKAMRDLEDYVKADDNQAQLVRLPAELSGVLGFMDGCLCTKDRELKSHDSPQDVGYSFRRK